MKNVRKNTLLLLSTFNKKFINLSLRLFSANLTDSDNNTANEYNIKQRRNFYNIIPFMFVCLFVMFVLMLRKKKDRIVDVVINHNYELEKSSNKLTIKALYLRYFERVLSAYKST